MRGRQVSGELEDVHSSDDSYPVYGPALTQGSHEPPVWLILDAVSTMPDPVEMTLTVESAVDTPGVVQGVELFNYVTGMFEEVDVRTVPENDAEVIIAIDGDASRFIHPDTLEVKAQLTWMPPPLVATFPWQVKIDRVIWEVVE